MTETIEIRSSSFALLMDCAAMWEAIHINGAARPSTPAAHMGTSIHYGTAIYDKERIDRRAPTKKQAVEAAMYRFDDPQEDVHWTALDYSKTEARAITIKATELYCDEIAPHFAFSEVELRPAPVDVGFENGITIRLTGQMDRTRIMAADPDLYPVTVGHGINDLKTGKRIITRGEADTRGHKFQIGIYEIIYEQHARQPITLPASISAVSTARQPQAAVGMIHGAKELMVGTDEQPGILEQVALQLKAGIFTPNPRSILCSERYCPIYHRCKAHD